MLHHMCDHIPAAAKKKKKRKEQEGSWTEPHYIWAGFLVVTEPQFSLTTDAQFTGILDFLSP